MAVETENVAEEIQQEEAVQPQEQEAQQAQSPEESSPQKEISDKEKNFLRMRETKEQLERENRELKQAIQSHAQPKTSEDEEDSGIDDDDIVEGKAYNKLYKKVESLERSYQIDKIATVPDRLKSKFSDFDQVVTQENVEKLKQAEPELYSSITSGSDLYAKGVSAYKTLKALGIATPSQDYSSDKEMVQQNQIKPRSAQAVKGQGALSEANIFAKGLTPELKKQLQSEMTEAAKGR